MSKVQKIGAKTLVELKNIAKQYEELEDKLNAYPEIYGLIVENYNGNPLAALGELLEYGVDDLWEEE